MLVMRGEYGETGRASMRLLLLVIGDPRPAIPLTLYLLVLKDVLLEDVGSARLGTGGGGVAQFWTRRFNAGSDWWPRDGGVSEPDVGVVPWLFPPSLEVSVDLSVRKLALDFRRSCRMLRNDGAMLLQN